VRLFVRSPEGLIPVDAVEPARPTVLCFDAASYGSASLVDVLCLRPDGLTWHLGSAAARPGRHHYEVELNPFSLAGTHVITVEVGGRALPTRLPIEVLPTSRPPRGRPGRRYLGRGLR
jgi:hypothetical protein